MLQSLVTSSWLNNHLHEPNLIVLYTTLIPKKQSIPSEIINLQIKGARFFDLQHRFSDQASGLPNTYPSTSQFERECRRLGINKNSKIVVYDSLGIYSSPRVWFLFKSMGHESVFVLDGGFSQWIKDGFETVSTIEETYKQGDFEANFNPNVLINKERVQNNLKTNVASVIDARSALRFKGESPEPREGLRSGNIPSSCNLHYASLLNNGKYKAVTELEQLFKSFKNEKELIFSCGSGITACILYLAADELLDSKLSVYDGSWTEWGRE